MLQIKRKTWLFFCILHHDAAIEPCLLEVLNTHTLWQQTAVSYVIYLDVACKVTDVQCDTLT